MTPQPYILHRDEQLPGGPGLKASAESTGGMISLIDSTTTGGAPLHIHRDEDECFYVVEGRITIRCGEERWEANAGAFVFLPRGIPHAWDVVGDEARVLIITTPGGFERFLQEFHDADPDQRNTVAERYGITFLPDPEW